jgi:hypothetical protein
VNSECGASGIRHAADGAHAVEAHDDVRARILEVRGEKVMLDQDPAALYGVAVEHLYQAVRRNRDRFPPDFMFQLTRDEWNNLRSQSMTSTAPRRTAVPALRVH